MACVVLEREKWLKTCSGHARCGIFVTEDCIMRQDPDRYGSARQDIYPVSTGFQLMEWSLYSNVRMTHPCGSARQDI